MPKLGISGYSHILKNFLRLLFYMLINNLNSSKCTKANKLINMIKVEKYNREDYYSM